jgi:uncharacterized membrane protein YdbT with pleckstrin-like domain
MQLNPGENLIKVFRKHWFVIFAESLLFLIIFILPIILVAVGMITAGLTISPIIQAILWVLGLAWLITMWVGFFMVYTDYYLDVWVLTDQRLIDIDQKGLFAREVAVLRLDKIQDVTTKQSGIFPTIFGYGNVHLQSAGTEREFIIYYVRNPKKIRDLLMEQQEEKSQEAKSVKIVT